ncbi:MAG: PDZ domain-containing protein [Candidatus Delongbacteria bacterium]
MKRLLFLLATLLLVFSVQAADYAFLGIVPEKSVKVKEAGFSGTGLLLRQVVAKGPAAEAGLRAGDVLITFNGKPVEDGDDLTFFLRQARPGEKATLEWVRNQTRQKGVVRLGSRNEPDLKRSVTVDVGSGLANTAFLGIGTLAVNDNLLQHFGVKDGHGILIDAIVKGSPAEKAGLRVGDVLVDLDGHAVDSPGRLRRLMEDYRPGTKVRLRLVRDRQILSVDIVFGDRDSSELGEPDEELPRIPEYPGMPHLPGLPQVQELKNVGTFPGRAAIDSTLNLMRRLVGAPLAMLER